MNNNPFWVALVAIVVIGFIGAYALLYPNSQGGLMALGALLPIAGGIGTYFFHTAANNFLGNQLAAQRTAFVATMGGNGMATGENSSATITNGSTNTPAASAMPPAGSAR